jgi:hypothetical protein
MLVVIYINDYIDSYATLLELLLLASSSREALASLYATH